MKVHPAFWTVVVVLVTTSLVAQGDLTNIHQLTTAPANARYEIVQSEIAAKWTFRLDRYTGHIAQLVNTKTNGTTWEDMEVIELKPTLTPTRARFQIFTSGIAARHTFMMDTDTGESWVLVSGKRKDANGSEQEVSLWQPFEK
jgi:hypothetical protein